MWEKFLTAFLTDTSVFIKTFWIQNKNSWDLETYWKIVIDFIRWKVHRCAAIQTSKSIVKIWHKLRWHFLTWIESWTILEMDGTLNSPPSFFRWTNPHMYLPKNKYILVNVFRIILTLHWPSVPCHSWKPTFKGQKSRNDFFK